MNLALLTLATLPLAPTPTDWPLQPRPQVVHGFELPAKPWLPGHRGIDLGGRPGQPVLAATPGTITYAGPLAGRGVVTITNGARRTTYEPVIAAVSVGATVTTGTVIGRLSAAGSHCLPRACLHWGLIQGKTYLNPLTLVPDRPVRLLPLAEHPSTAPPPHLAASNSSDSPAVSSPAAPSGGESGGDQRAARILIAATAALTLTAGFLIRRE
ncbi:murein hydrolase activator EnvC family protein [Kribbella sp. NPDC004875]|uniref:murein hydrolase activator EnvC family protein n=1 Tax=Kribbella sp. NPDC004875 TaxID=3364107 RepID=UPI0036B5D354